MTPSYLSPAGVPSKAGSATSSLPSGKHTIRLTYYLTIVNKKKEKISHEKAQKAQRKIRQDDRILDHEDHEERLKKRSLFVEKWPRKSTKCTKGTKK